MHDNAPDVEHDPPPGLATTEYPVMALPPVDAGALHDTTTCPFPGTPLTPDGAPGTVRGVTDTEESDATDVPATFTARTEKE